MTFHSCLFSTWKNCVGIRESFFLFPPEASGIELKSVAEIQHCCQFHIKPGEQIFYYALSLIYFAASREGRAFLLLLRDFPG